MTKENREKLYNLDPILYAIYAPTNEGVKDLSDLKEKKVDYPSEPIKVVKKGLESPHKGKSKGKRGKK